MSSGGKRVRNASAGAQTLQTEMSGSARLGQALAAGTLQKWLTRIWGLCLSSRTGHRDPHSSDISARGPLIQLLLPY